MMIINKTRCLLNNVIFLTNLIFFFLLIAMQPHLPTEVILVRLLILVPEQPAQVEGILRPLQTLEDQFMQAIRTESPQSFMQIQGLQVQILEHM